MDRYGHASAWSDEPPKPSERELLEWAATFSPRAEAELHRLQWAEATAKAEARQERELLEFMASFSEKHERELRALECKEAEEEETRERQRLIQFQNTQEIWDSSKHPRGAFPQNRGWWSSTDGSGSGAPADRDSAASRSAIWHSALPNDKLAAPGGSDTFGAGVSPQASLAAASRSVQLAVGFANEVGKVLAKFGLKTLDDLKIAPNSAQAKEALDNALASYVRQLIDNRESAETIRDFLNGSPSARKIAGVPDSLRGAGLEFKKVGKHYTITLKPAANIGVKHDHFDAGIGFTLTITW
jgi:hypothetical protein